MNLKVIAARGDKRKVGFQRSVTESLRQSEHETGAWSNRIGGPHERRGAAPRKLWPASGAAVLPRSLRGAHTTTNEGFQVRPNVNVRSHDKACRAPRLLRGIEFCCKSHLHQMLKQLSTRRWRRSKTPFFMT